MKKSFSKIFLIIIIAIFVLQMWVGILGLLFFSKTTIINQAQAQTTVPTGCCIFGGGNSGCIDGWTQAACEGQGGNWQNGKMCQTFDDCLATEPIKLEVSIPGVGNEVKNLPHYISAVYEYGVYAIVILSVVMIIVGGFMWILAAGNQSKIGTAKERIIDALVGLLLALLSYTILNIINPALVDLEMPGVVKVKPIAQGVLKASTICPAMDKVVCGDFKLFNPNDPDPAKAMEGCMGVYCEPFTFAGGTLRSLGQIGQFYGDVSEGKICSVITDESGNYTGGECVTDLEVLVSDLDYPGTFDTIKFLVGNSSVTELFGGGCGYFYRPLLVTGKVVLNSACPPNSPNQCYVVKSKGETPREEIKSDDRYSSVVNMQCNTQLAEVRLETCIDYEGQEECEEHEACNWTGVECEAVPKCSLTQVEVEGSLDSYLTCCRKEVNSGEPEEDCMGYDIQSECEADIFCEWKGNNRRAVDPKCQPKNYFIYSIIPPHTSCSTCFGYETAVDREACERSFGY
ncbi:MAG: hypothetical protein PHS07_03960 [Patescibacteria group bacterium]|nr:hypothetical protein [Patescibacteria group bacterium]